jgi:signal transduction histidine kinase
LRQAHPNVEFAAEGEFNDLEGDEALLRQALVNLARNAAESAEQGASQRGAAPRVWLQGAVEAKGSSRMQKIHVFDNGLGIANADLTKLFLPFHTTKSGGTGLGLAVVQKITVHHGGSVAARNLEAGGAEFILTLPMRQAQTAKAVDSASGSI